MAELNEVLGAILRDVAKARVVSDAFSLEASAAYREDDVLRGFPVPRVEIGTASIDLAFAVTAVEERPVVAGEIVGGVAVELGRRAAAALARQLLESSPRRGEAEAHLAAQGIDFRELARAQVEGLLRANPDAALAAADGAPAELERLALAAVKGLVTQDTGLAPILGRGLRVQEVRATVADAAGAAFADLERRLERGSDEPGRVAGLVEETADRLATDIVATLTGMAPRPDAAREVLDAERVRLGRVVAAGLSGHGEEELTALVAGDRPVLRRELVAGMETVLLDTPEVREALTRRTPAAELDESIARVVSPWVAEAAKALAAARERAAQRAPVVSVAVTAAELDVMPPERLSRITMTATVRNYQWAEHPDEGDLPGRLVPE